MPGGPFENALETEGLGRPVHRGRCRVGPVEMLLDDLLQVCRIAAAVKNDLLPLVEKKAGVEEVLRRDELMPPDIRLGIRRHDDPVEVFADLHDSSPSRGLSDLLQRAFQREFPVLGQLMNPHDPGCRDVIGIDPADPLSFVVDVDHDPRGVRRRFVEDRYEDLDDKVHRRIIVVVQDHPVHPRFPDLLFCACIRF
jgi:hypothetical protein